MHRLSISSNDTAQRKHSLLHKTFVEQPVYIKTHLCLYIIFQISLIFKLNSDSVSEKLEVLMLVG